jgi:hypothetical protein
MKRDVDLISILSEFCNFYTIYLLKGNYTRISKEKLKVIVKSLGVQNLPKPN